MPIFFCCIYWHLNIWIKSHEWSIWYDTPKETTPCVWHLVVAEMPSFSFLEDGLVEHVKQGSKRNSLPPVSCRFLPERFHLLWSQVPVRTQQRAEHVGTPCTQPRIKLRSQIWYCALQYYKCCLQILSTNNESIGAVHSNALFCSCCCWSTRCLHSGPSGGRGPITLWRREKLK